MSKKILNLNYEFPGLGGELRNSHSSYNTKVHAVRIGGAGNATYYLLKEFAKYKDLNII